MGIFSWKVPFVLQTVAKLQKSWQIQTESVLRNLSVSSKCILACWSSCFNKQIVLGQWNKMPTRLYLFPELTKELFLLCFWKIVKCTEAVQKWCWKKSKWDVSTPLKFGHIGTFYSAPSHAWHDCALTAPPHPHPPLWEYVCSRPTSRPSDKQDKAGWNWEKLRMTGWWQWAHIVWKTQTADTHTQIRKQEIWKGSNEECLEHA